MKSKLKLVDRLIEAARPRTMDELINVVHSIPEISNNGTHFKIVKYKGYTQGIRVYITGSKISHPFWGKVKDTLIRNGHTIYLTEYLQPSKYGDQTTITTVRPHQIEMIED